MLCLPGFVPVMKDDQATGEIGGLVVFRGEKLPSSFRAFRLGSFPSAMNPSASSGSEAVQTDNYQPGDLRRRVVLFSL